MVYAKAAKQVIDLTAEDVSEAEEDDTYEAENLVDEDGDFNLFLTGGQHQAQKMPLISQSHLHT